MRRPISKALVILSLFAFILLGFSLGYATDWYVRPDGAGAKDGTAYADAWEGLDNVVWGGAGVDAGDTLYVCGTHIYGTHHTSLNGLEVTTSGTSGNIITIRGDYGGDAGTIWSSRQWTSGWTDNGDGSFYQGTTWNVSYVAEGDVGSEVLLRKKVNQAEVAATDGSFWHDTEVPKTLWYNPTGGIVKTVWYYWVTCAIDLNGNSYIKIQDLKLRGGGGNRGVIMLDRDESKAPSNIEINGCDIAFGQHTGIYTNEPTTDVTIDNCVFHDLPTAIYGHGNGHNDWIIKDCEAYSGNDTEIIYSQSAGDRHVLAAQGGTGWLIERNYIYDWAGDGINLYLGLSGSIANAIIRYNFFINLNDDNDANHHYAIYWGGNNENPALPGALSGIKVYYNIIANCGGNVGDSEGIAIRAKGGDNEMSSIPEVSNNVIYDCNFGLYCAHDGTNNSIAVKYKNNIVLSPKTGGYHTAFQAATADTTGVTYDYNCYYPDTGNGDNQFQWRGTLSDDFADWKTDSSQDANSLNSDPLMTDPANDDFTLLMASPCIDKGTDVGLTKDYAGNTVPQGFAPDIGAYEHDEEETSIIPSIIPEIIPKIIPVIKIGL